MCGTYVRELYRLSVRFDMSKSLVVSTWGPNEPTTSISDIFALKKSRWYDLEFQSPASRGHDPYTWQNMGQMSVGSKYIAQTDELTDMIDCITFPANAVGD